MRTVAHHYLTPPVSSEVAFYYYTIVVSPFSLIVCCSGLITAARKSGAYPISWNDKNRTNTLEHKKGNVVGQSLDSPPRNDASLSHCLELCTELFMNKAPGGLTNKDKGRGFHISQNHTHAKARECSLVSEFPSP